MKWDQDTERYLAARERHPSHPRTVDARRLFADMRGEQARRRRLTAALWLAIVATGLALFAGLGIWLVGAAVVTFLFVAVAGAR